MPRIDAQYRQWSAEASIDLIVASEGRVAAVNVAIEEGKLSVSVQESDIELVRELMKARGLNIVQSSV